MVFVADIVDECLLGVDFLSKVGLEEIFESVLGNIPEKGDLIELECSRIGNFETKVPHELRDLYERNSLNLDETHT